MSLCILKYLGPLLAGASVAFAIYFDLIKIKKLEVPEVFKNKFGSFFEKRRTKKIDGQLTEVVSMLMSGLRAGLGLQQSFEMVSKEAPDPIRQEFIYIINQITLGKDLDDALVEWEKRISLDDVTILVEAILVLRQTGGNLISTFSSILSTISERQKVSRKISVFVAQGMSQAVVMLLLPVALMFALLVISPWYIKPLFTERLGCLLVFIMLVLQTVGALWLRKIVKIKI